MVPPVGLRRRLELSIVGAVGIALIVLVAAFNVVLRDRVDHEAKTALVARASGELASLTVKGDRLTVPEVPDRAALDAQTWVFAGTRVLEHPRSDPVTERAAAQLAQGPGRTLDLPAVHRRLYSVPVVAGGRRLGTVVAEVSVKPYENTAQIALVASIVLGALILLLVAVGGRVLISAALRPVLRMTSQAAEWSEADAPGRFGLGPPHDELTQLAATLDRLLDRVATSLRHEQRFTAELSHELRTPLTSVIAEAQLALRHPKTAEEYRAGFEQILGSARQMSRTLDTLVSVARVELQQPHGTGDAAAAARAAADGCVALAERRGVEIDVLDPSIPIRVGVDSDVVERVLVPLVENGCRYGHSSVQISIDRRDGVVSFLVADDGPGVPAGEHERIFEPGWRGSGHDANAGGAGLGLSLARRLARAAGGDVESEPGGDHGARFTVRLPGA
jgi:signal transduction histidine kinase